MADREKFAVEVATDEAGNVLWIERYIFKRIHGPGESFVKDKRTYVVVASSHTEGKHGAILVEHVVRDPGACFPPKPDTQSKTVLVTPPNSSVDNTRPLSEYQQVPTILDSETRMERIEEFARDNAILHNCLAYAESLRLGREVAMELAVCALVEDNQRLEQDLVVQIQRKGTWST